MNTILKTLKVIYSDRIDKYISQNESFSRQEVQNMISMGAIYVDEILVRKANFMVNPTQTIYIHEVESKPIKVTPEPLEIDVVYEDDDVIIINKKSGIVVHPAPGNYYGTLVGGLLYKYQNLSSINGNFRPGIVHRLDKDTSGLLIVAKNNFAHKFLANELKQHKIKRIYLAWVEGHLSHKVIHINLPIGRNQQMRQKMGVTKINSKEAITHVKVLKVTEKYSLIECELETGRTHQIRVHLSHIGHPIVGDPLYGNKIDNFGQRLHAAKLEFIHPTTKAKLHFLAPLPPEFDNFLDL